MVHSRQDHLLLLDKKQHSPDSEVELALFLFCKIFPKCSQEAQMEEEELLQWHRC